MKSNKPASSEYNAYYNVYIDRAGDGAPVDLLQEGLRTTTNFFKDIPDSKHELQYESGKWTPKDILQHIIDTERVFAYRALQFARAEDVVLKGFDQDEFAQNTNANNRTMMALLDEYMAVRMATIHFTKSCSEEVLQRIGIASNSPLSVRAALYIIVGHEIHHREVIKKRYL